MNRACDLATTHILFDFFGTLVDYSPGRIDHGHSRSHALLMRAGSSLDYESFFNQWNDVSEQFEREAITTSREYSMRDVARSFLLRAVGKDAADPLLDEFISLYLEEWNTGVRYLGGVSEMLERLAGRFELGIITNTHQPDLVPGHLEKMGVAHLFREVVTSVEHGRRKPHVSIFRHTLDLVEAPAADCLYVGDSLTADFEGARAAGLGALLIDAGEHFAIAREHGLRNILELESWLEPA